MNEIAHGLVYFVYGVCGMGGIEVTIGEAGQVFGYKKKDIDAMFYRGMTPKQAMDRLDVFKKHVRDEFRALSKVLHPDVGGDHAKYVELKEAYEAIMSWKVVARKRSWGGSTIIWKFTSGSYVHTYQYTTTASSDTSTTGTI